VAKKTQKKRAPKPQSEDVGIDPARAKEARAKAGMTFIELAYKSGLPLSMLWRIEAGASDIRASNVVRFARTLDVSSDWLLRLSNSPKRQG
jgi:transcriptional regulator with XRE-family HTH domain